MDPDASRETLDHSIMYIFAVALEDANWHHIKSYTKKRAKRKSTIKIWRSIKTHEDKKWTKKYGSKISKPKKRKKKIHLCYAVPSSSNNNNNNNNRNSSRQTTFNDTRSPPRTSSPPHLLEDLKRDMQSTASQLQQHQH